MVARQERLKQLQDMVRETNRHVTPRIVSQVEPEPVVARSRRKLWRLDSIFAGLATAGQ